MTAIKHMCIAFIAKKQNNDDMVIDKEKYNICPYNTSDSFWRKGKKYGYDVMVMVEKLMDIVTYFSWYLIYEKILVTQ